MNRSVTCLKTTFLLLAATAITPACFAQSGRIGIGTITPTDQLHTTGALRLQGYSGTATRVLQIDTAGRLVAPGPVSTYTNAITITDNGCGTGNGVSNAISITGMPVVISSSRITVRLTITHPYAGDLRIYLAAPNGQLLNLSDKEGGVGDNYTNTVFTDAASVAITTGTPPYTGSFRPEGTTGTPCTSGTLVTSFAGFGGGHHRAQWIVDDQGV